MKISRRHLRALINEEMNRLNEESGDSLTSSGFETGNTWASLNWATGKEDTPWGAMHNLEQALNYAIELWNKTEAIPVADSDHDVEAVEATRAALQVMSNAMPYSS